MNDQGHFSLEDAVDFARGSVAADRRPQLQQHLARCLDCQRLVDSWRAVASAMDLDERYEPPSHVMRIAKAAFAGAEKPQGALARIRETAKLVFDSRFAPLPVGVRASGSDTHKLLYESRDLIFDVQVQPAAEPAKTVVIGQVMRPARAEGGPKDAPVLLFSRERTIARTTTNGFGEFQMEFENAAVLSLTVDVDGAPVVIPLDMPSVDGKPNSRRKHAKNSY